MSNRMEIHKNTYRVLTEETKKRQEINYKAFLSRTPSINRHLTNAKSFGKADAAAVFNIEKPTYEDIEDVTRYALCRSIVYIRNLNIDKEDKFDLITMLIKDWKYGCAKRLEVHERIVMMQDRKKVIRKVAKKRFAYPGATPK